jgi:transposase-like protein
MKSRLGGWQNGSMWQPQRQRGAFWGRGVAQTADEAGLSAAYGEFQQGAIALKPDYVNTDGWDGTQLAWKSLFPSSTLMRCFLHKVLGIQQAMGRKCKVFEQTTDRLWQLYHSPTGRCFGQRLRRWLEWAATQAMPQKAQQQLEKLAQRAEIFK